MQKETRYGWTNKLELIDRLLKGDKLEYARKYALESLKMDKDVGLFTEEEVEYLKLVVALKSLDDYMKGITDDI